MNSTSNMISPDFVQEQQRLCQLAGLHCSDSMIEPESKEYAAWYGRIHNYVVYFRVAKITPTKVGQFVTFWKRLASGPIAPFDIVDVVDFLIVRVQDGQHAGHFVFPQSVLLEQGVLSRHGIGGKRALRVYPPWDVADNKQAIKTQAWQVRYFYDDADIQKIKKLFAE